MKKIVSIVSTNRADFGLLKPLIIKLNDHPKFDLRLSISGSHLSDEFGKTVNEINALGLIIDKEIPIFDSFEETLFVSKAMSKAIEGFSEYFSKLKPDLVILLGDRYETLSVAISAMTLNILIAHIHGGEITEGAMDDAIRHAITKLSHLHFTSTEVYRNRVIQMGESPDSVFNVGALAIDNIIHENFYSKQEVYDLLGLKLEEDFALVTYHPVTLENESITEIKKLLEICSELNEYKFIFTKSNPDYLGFQMNQEINKYAEENENIKLFDSLGSKLFLSAMKYSKAILGNSSSGIIEAPYLGTKTINVGTRQKGRIQFSSIINVDAMMNDLKSVIQEVFLEDNKDFIKPDIYGLGDTAEKIINVLIFSIIDKKTSLKKVFYDL